MNIIYNNDGSIKLLQLNEYINQYDDNSKKIFVSVDDSDFQQLTWNCTANFELPNGSTNTLLGVWKTNVEIDQTTYNGFEISLTQAQTLYAGVLSMSLKLQRLSVVKYTYVAQFTINKTIGDPDEVKITLSEYNALVNAMATKQTTYVAGNVRGYLSKALADNDLSNVAEGQIIIVNENGLLKHYKKIGGAYVGFSYAEDYVSQEQLTEVETALLNKINGKNSAYCFKASASTLKDGQGNTFTIDENTTFIVLNITTSTLKDYDGSTPVVIEYDKVKVGDSLYLYDTNIPDFWVGQKSQVSAGEYAIIGYKLETGKVDLTNVAKTNVANTFTQQQTFNYTTIFGGDLKPTTSSYDVGTATKPFRDAHFNNDLYLGYALFQQTANDLVVKIDSTIALDLFKDKAYIKDLLPYQNNNFDIGSTDDLWKDLYLSNNIHCEREKGIYNDNDSKWILRYNFGNGIVDTEFNLCPIGNKDLGLSYRKWKDIYLSGQVKTDGGIATTTDGGATSIGLKLWKGTQAQYDSITTPDANTLYIIV